MRCSYQENWVKIKYHNNCLNCDYMIIIKYLYIHSLKISSSNNIYTMRKRNIFLLLLLIFFILFIFVLICNNNTIVQISAITLWIRVSVPKITSRSTDRRSGMMITLRRRTWFVWRLSSSIWGTIHPFTSRLIFVNMTYRSRGRYKIYYYDM